MLSTKSSLYLYNKLTLDPGQQQKRHISLLQTNSISDKEIIPPKQHPQNSATVNKPVS